MYVYRVENKQGEILLTVAAKYRNNNLEIPSRETLKELLLIKSFTKIGETYGVTDNAVRKWCKKYNLPFRKKDIIKP